MKTLTIQDLRREYPEKVCICKVHLRDAESHHVVSWICLETVDSVEVARGVLECLALDGVTDAVAITTNKEIAIEGDLAAKFFRISLGLE